MVFYEKIKDVDLGGTGPHQVDFRGATSFVPSGCWCKPTVFIKNTRGLQKMRTVLLIILEVEWTPLDKISEGNYDPPSNPG